MSQRNKDRVLAYVGAFNRRDLDGVCNQFADDALIWGVLGWGKISVARPIWNDLMESLHIHLTVEGMVGEGDTVVARYTERGTSLKAFRGFEATGKSYEVAAMEWFEIKDGLIHRR